MSDEQKIKELEERIKRLENGLIIEQFFKGLALLGYQLSLTTITASTEKGDDNA